VYPLQKKLLIGETSGCFKAEYDSIPLPDFPKGMFGETEVISSFFLRDRLDGS
jgi:hypothetical protein